MRQSGKWRLVRRDAWKLNQHTYKSYLITLFAIATFALFLSSCVRTQPQQETSAIEQQPWNQVWQTGLAQVNEAVKQLVQKSDQAIENRQYDKAATTLERVLRIDNRVATVWSRLAWLAIAQQQYKRAQNLIIRSNSLSVNNKLLQFNWRMYRDASDYRNDTAGVHRATQQLKTLN